MKTVRRPLFVLAMFQVLFLLLYGVFGRTSEGRISSSKVRLTGTVCEIKKYETDGEETYYFTVKGGRKPFQKILLKISGRNLRKSLFHFPARDEIRIGEKIGYQGRVEGFEVAKNLGSFDRSRYYTNEGYSGSIKVDAIRIYNQSLSHKIRYWLPNQLFRLRNRIKEQYEKILGKTVSGTLAAMVLGDKTELDAEIKELYADNAISHLLAISGLHISLVGALFYQFLKKINLSFHFSLILPILFLFLYGSFTGFSISTTRAVLMMTFFFLSFLIGRSYDLPSALAFSSILILGNHPGMLYQAGFQLSFLAVIGIFYGVKQAEAIFVSKGGKQSTIWERWKNFVKASILSTITINLVLLPVLLWHYFEIPLNGIFLNLVTIPLMSILVVTGLLGGILSFLSLLLATFLLGSTNYILEFYTFVCRLADGNPWNKLVLGRPSIVQIVLYYIILCFLLWKLERERRRERILELKRELTIKERKRSRKIRKYFLAALLPIAIYLLSTRKKEVELHELDVGEGYCDVVGSEKGGCYLINCGSTSVKNVGKNVLIPFIKYHGWNKIKGIFITDMGEAYTSGILEILEKKEIGIGQCFLPDFCLEKDKEKRNEMIRRARERGIKICYFKNKGRWTEGNVTFSYEKKRLKLIVTHPNKE